MATTVPGLIDRQASTPFYQQLFDVLEARIQKGQIEQGARLPSENEICGEFGLSRATVRQALQRLESRGLVRRVTGRGVYATEPASERGWVIQGPQGFLENAIGHQNRSVRTEVLDHGPIMLPTNVCRALDISEPAAGYRLVRRRLLDGTPALYSVNYSPPALVSVVASADAVLDGSGSLSEVLASAGYVLGGAHREIRATPATPEIAEALEIEPTTSILHVRSTSWTSAGERYDVYDTFVRSDVVPLEVNVNTTGG